MKVIKASAELLNAPEYAVLLDTVERAGRTCYKSEDKIQEGSAEKFIKAIIARGHESVLEHSLITVRFICDRGVSHEIVRHRLASFSQASTRCCNYSQDRFGNETSVIKPCFFEEKMTEVDGTITDYSVWYTACKEAEGAYFALLDRGCTPEEARSVLPNSLATELVMSANIREWRHFLRLRCSPAAHPQMREVACELAHILKQRYPVFFEDIQ